MTSKQLVEIILILDPDGKRSVEIQAEALVIRNSGGVDIGVSPKSVFIDHRSGNIVINTYTSL